MFSTSLTVILVFAIIGITSALDIEEQQSDQLGRIIQLEFTNGTSRLPTNLLGLGTSLADIATKALAAVATLAVPVIVIIGLVSVIGFIIKKKKSFGGFGGGFTDLFDFGHHGLEYGQPGHGYPYEDEYTGYGHAPESVDSYSSYKKRADSSSVFGRTLEARQGKISAEE